MAIYMAASAAEIPWTHCSGAAQESQGDDERSAGYGSAGDLTPQVPYPPADPSPRELVGIGEPARYGPISQPARLQLAERSVDRSGLALRGLVVRVDLRDLRIRLTHPVLERP